MIGGAGMGVECTIMQAGRNAINARHQGSTMVRVSCMASYPFCLWSPISSYDHMMCLVLPAEWLLIYIYIYIIQFVCFQVVQYK